MGGAPVLTGQYNGYAASQEARFAALPLLPSNDSIGTPVAGPPVIVMDLCGISTVFKPCGWEVDSVGGGDGPLLSTYMQSCFTMGCFPLIHSRDFGFGFLHRLDIPSSGLVLSATAFEGLYAL